MTFAVDIESAREQFPDYEFVSALTPSAQKAAFHVRRDDRDYCLKIIAPNQALDRVQREVLAMQRMNHPNISKVFEYEYSARIGNARHYLVEEFVAGDDLSEHMTAGNGWSIQKIKAAFVPLCDGLAALEAQGIVHRDLKPSNIRIRPTGEPVIIDFGLARMLDMSSMTPTIDGAMLGTPRYFAPEQFRGTKRDIDCRTDLYALGVILYEAAVGRHPSLTSVPKTMDELSEAVCTSESYAADDAFKALPEHLQLIVRRLLQKERAKRPLSAEMVGSILRRIGSE